MSASKVRLATELTTAAQQRDDYFFKVVRLLNYLHCMREDYPNLNWPELPDEYSETMWRYAV